MSEAPDATIDLSFLEADAVAVAPQLLGWRLYRCEATGLVGGTIIETEAYIQNDAASHSYRGETPRTAVMFGPAGHIYVYFTYGLHHCLNIVCGRAGSGEAVLIRALLPDEGLVSIRQRRPGQADQQLTNGPAKLCQALMVTMPDNGKLLNASEFLLLPPNAPLPKIVATPRIGIAKDTARLWRFVIVT